MLDIEIIKLIKETLVDYKLMINDNLINTIANPSSTLENCKLHVGQMGGAEGFALSLIEILTPEDDNE